MQKGNISKKGRSWILKYRIDTVRDGKPYRSKVSRKLAPVCDQYRTVASVRPLAEVFLSPINSKRSRPESSQTVASFIEDIYLPHCKEQHRPSTYAGYQYIFELIKPHLRDLRLFQFRTSDGERILRELAEEKKRAHTVLQNMKSFLSGAFRYAKRLDAIEQNPMHDTFVPRGKPQAETYAYSLDEIHKMLKVLPEPAKTIVLVAALTGLRQSEIRGLRWEDVIGDDLHIRRGVWETHVSETKTRSSSAPVPLLPVLKTALEEHRKRMPGKDFIFHGVTNKPLHLHNIDHRDIAPKLKEIGLQWRGWHGFRRGLASTLYDLGVPDKVIQAILRHANVSTTMRHYVKTSAASSHTAMKKLEHLIRT
jgi:integrase